MTQIPEELIDLVEELIIYENSKLKEYTENFLELEYPEYYYEEDDKEKDSIIYIEL